MKVWITDSLDSQEAIMTNATPVRFSNSVHKRHSGGQYKLIGYWLSNPNSLYQHLEARLMLEDQCASRNHQLQSMEWEHGLTQNPLRLGLWKTLRLLVCSNCPPTRVSFSITDFTEFLDQALSPCSCNDNEGLDGIVLNNLKHLSNDPFQTNQFLLKMAEIDKHVITIDGICLSCCHPTTKQLLAKRKQLVAL